MQVKSLIHQVCIYLLCILICLPSLHAPYLSGSILLILICFHYGYKAECAAALLLFIYAISKYYFADEINHPVLHRNRAAYSLVCAHSKKDKT